MAESGQPIKIGNSFAIEEIKQALVDLEGTEFDTLDERLKAVDEIINHNREVLNNSIEDIESIDNIISDSLSNNKGVPFSSLKERILYLDGYVDTQAKIIKENSLHITEYAHLVENGNWTKPLQQAMKDIINGNTRGLVKSLYFPVGVYKFSPNALSGYEGQLKRGFTFLGENSQSSIWYLDNPTNDMAYLYDNGEDGINRKMERVLFQNLGFTGSSRETCKLFKVTSINGFDKHYSFMSCSFGAEVTDAMENINDIGGLSSILDTAGVRNADVMRFYDCRGTKIEDYVVNLGNHQSVIIEFFSCWWMIYGDFSRYADGNDAGGSLHVYGGGIEMYYKEHPDTSTETTMRWLVNAENSDHRLSNCDISFNDTRLEMHGTMKGLVVATLRNAGETSVVFNGCNLAASIRHDQEVVRISARKKVTFRDCILHHNFRYSIVGTYAESSSPQHGGLLLFDGCKLGTVGGGHIVDRITIQEIGRAKGINNTVWGTRTVGRPEVTDFDLNWRNMLPGEPSVAKKTVLFAPNFVSFPSGSTSGTEWSIKLPVGALLTRIYVRKLSGASGSADYRINVGRDDKTVSYGRSTTAPQIGEHIIDVYPELTMTASNNTVRLWVDPNFPGNASGHRGIAYIEFI